MRLLVRPPQTTAELVSQSYDHAADGYDEAWTNHMRELSLRMLDRLGVPAGARCVDLTCGTGFITAELARRTGRRALGVDASEGMLAVARRTRADCDFVQADVLAFLRSRPAGSEDVITCGWGLGYSKPLAVVREIARVLRPDGRVGIIDNSLLSLAEVLWVSCQTFAECPHALRHAMNVRFLPNSHVLAVLMRLVGLGVPWRDGGAKTYSVPDGRAAIDRLMSTGAAAGFEYAVDEANRERIFARFAKLLDRRYARVEGIPITHRYLAAVGWKRT